MRAAVRPRAALYIDGFNFYYGVRNHFLGAKEERGYSLSGLCWCDFRALAERHFGVDVDFIRYFTAPVTEGVSNAQFPGEHERYHLWRGAVESIRGLSVVEGHYVARDAAGARPDGARKTREEKQTDVQIAVEMLLDAVSDTRAVDTVLLLTGDQDQWPAACALALRLSKPMRVGILLPPRASVELARRQIEACQKQLLERHRRGEKIFGARGRVWVETLTEEMLANSLLPYEIAPGISCPSYWRLHHNYLDRVCKLEHRPDRRGAVAG